ncbi:hypothetical protein [Haladaptatus salinisoli]|uniref:hypothetical protein n=1 Tax=Haladaptatus salinisoli TaxID=2884876 RepID=UPI001D0B46B5|nr:hypothetical protein [Haladaptatus salinisoli]
MPRARFDVTTVMKAFVSLLLLVGLWVAYSHLRSGDVDEFVAFLPALYIFVLLTVGVFRDATRERWYQVALWVGVTVWGGVEYLLGGGWWELALVAVGLLMLASVGYERLQTRE